MDRLTFNATLIENGTEFQHLARTKANKTNRTKQPSRPTQLVGDSSNPLAIASNMQQA
ncbi:hypothetical protein ACFRCI_19990 [Streptomyces sp. NPDC056638]|uniref:hypothetical protein n=1 Tax=Streptomyces sp. NPDC056638 TaxID=3345887 RepID=UPI00368EAC28